MIKWMLSVVLALLLPLPVHAQIMEAAWECDGDPDSDDVGALALAGCIAADAKRSAYITHVGFKNDLTKPNSVNARRMRDTADGLVKFCGIRPSVIFDYSKDPIGAKRNLSSRITQLRTGYELVICAAGPMETIYAALATSSPTGHQFVHIISHSDWNNDRSVNGGHTLDDIQDDFDVNVTQIRDQNVGLRTSTFSPWYPFRDSRDPKQRWFFLRLLASNKPDASDAGMAMYAAFGTEYNTPQSVYEKMND